LNSIAGKNHLAIEYSHGLIQENGKWEKNDKYLAVFGFTNGKLSLIKELWLKCLTNKLWQGRENPRPIFEALCK